MKSNNRDASQLVVGVTGLARFGSGRSCSLACDPLPLSVSEQSGFQFWNCAMVRSWRCAIVGIRGLWHVGVSRIGVLRGLLLLVVRVPKLRLCQNE